MTLDLNKKMVFSEFEWVIRVLDSAETQNQMDVVQNCFSVWEKKHTLKKLNPEETKLINYLRSKYWAKFKNKIFSIGATSYFYK